jgi:vacuolar-type H+-ATPase subunit C/Vma6
MSDIVLAFLERWTEENVGIIAAADQQDEAERLTAACIEDAFKEGFTEDELSETVTEATEGGDLVSYFAAAIEKAADAGEALDAEGEDDE